MLLRRIFDADPSLEVIGEASDGREAVELARRLRPDVITMDVQMPVMDGLEATRRIMETDPRPVVVVSGSLDPGDVKEAFRALEAGAVAIVRKPSAPTDPGFRAQVEEIVTTVKLMSEVKVVKRRGRERAAPAPTVPRASKKLSEIVAIAASTGGPAALEVILRELPAGLPVPVVVVQHIARGFEQGLVDWLQSISPLNVRLASRHVPLTAGEVVVSAGGHHLVVTRKATTLGDDEPVDGHCPSATTLFSSVAASWGDKALGVILTGMGRDGTRGLIRLKEAGGRVLAQDADSSVVNGMPRAAAEAGVVDHLLPVDAIAAAIVKMCSPSAFR